MKIKYQFQNGNVLGAAMVFLVLLTVVIFSVYGYVENIIKLVGASALHMMEVVRIIGIFVPLVGAIAGYN